MKSLSRMDLQRMTIIQEQQRRQFKNEETFESTKRSIRGAAEVASRAKQLSPSQVALHATPESIKPR